MNRGKYAFVGLEVTDGLARGAAGVLFAWVTLVVSNEISVVGILFLTIHLTNLVCGPFAGTMVDRMNRRKASALGHVIIASSMLALGMIVFIGGQLQVWQLFSAAACATFGRLIFRSSLDSLVPEIFSLEKTKNVMLIVGGAHLLATAAGTTFVGFVIGQSSIATGFFIAAAFSIPIVALSFLVAKEAGDVLGETSKKYFSEFFDGMQQFVASRSLRWIAILAMVTVPIGQLSNAILSSLVRDSFDGNSAMFGIADAAWPIGGMIGTTLLGLVTLRDQLKSTEIVCALLLGLFTAALAFAPTFAVVVILHGMMGVFASCCRLLFAARIVSTESREHSGKNLANMQALVSLSAVLMTSSPLLIGIDSASFYFGLWGAIALAVALYMLPSFLRSEDLLQPKLES